MKRVLSGIVLMAILAFSIWSSNPYYFTALAAIVLALALWEFYRLAERVGCHCYSFLGYCASAIVVYSFTRNQLALILPACVALLLAMMIAALFESKNEADFQKILASVAATLLGVFYVVFLASFLIGVRVIHISSKGPRDLPSRLLSLFFLIIIASDTGAYYTGKNLGRHKLAPRISPGKTIEGSIGGLLLALMVALISKYSFLPEMPTWHALALALMMNIIGQMGDLFESLLKRGAGAKDAAAIIPGHGGLLDRLDSILFNAPLLYYYYYISSFSK
jgi:phosphatidate cytidylyltransferase